MMVKYRTVSRTIETQPIKGWVYQVIEDRHGCLIKRVSEENSTSWSHGTLCKLYQPDRDCFVEVILADSTKRVPDLDTALAVIERQ